MRAFTPALGLEKLSSVLRRLMAMHSVEKEGGFKPEDASPEKAVAERPFPVLLICGTRDHTIPCRHAERIYKAARGPKELWVVRGAEHASALGRAPEEI